MPGTGALPILTGTGLSSTADGILELYDINLAALISALSATIPITPITNNYQTTGGEVGGRIVSTAAGAITITLAVGTFAVGQCFEVFQDGAGQVSFAAAGGVTIKSPNNALKIAEQYGTVAIIYVGNSTFCLAGSLST